jgi:hypothetical protein
MLGSKYLTGETHAQVITYPGQAHFAIPGAKAVCRDCWFWSPRRPNDKRAVCGKAASMSPGRRPASIPRYATICQYFTETAPAAD